MTIVKKSFQYGDHQVTLETGRIARQASGAVLITMDDTAVLVTVVGVPKAKEGQGFFPLTVNYQEKTYAAGKIPGGFFKREGRPSEKETLTSRLIDRPLRPLFPKDFKNEVQVIATVMSLDPEIDSDIPALIGASAALAISGIPFSGPVGAARVGYKDGQYLLNPTATQLLDSELNLVVAGTKDAVLMVESEAKELTEEVMLGSVVFGHEQMQVAIQAINELAAEVGTTAWDWSAEPEDTALLDRVKQLIESDLGTAYSVADKLVRQDKVSELRDRAITEISTEDESGPSEDNVRSAFDKIEKELVRNRILSGTPRIDGRDTKTVRPITIELGLLPRVHGSALFTRGETQAIVAATLGTDRDAQIIDSLSGESRDRFMLHYNFPPYSVGEAGFMGSPKRREIGHGRLAKRALMAIIPHEDDFPYVLRVVSEITESNGSSSMASVCGTSLALMDAGVPVKAPVAGIAMGLIKEGDQFAVLTDILGDEDHLGDMDFKVAGTQSGITALQMDIKIQGITKEIMSQALAQAKDGRLHILGIMNQAVSAPRDDISNYAPRITCIRINPDKIRDIIGKGGATIREITETTGATIDITDDGLVKIAAVDGESGRKAKEWVEQIVAEVEIGKTYEGKVAKIMDFGAFVDFMSGKSGLVHVSQIAQERVENVRDFLEEGQIVLVKVLEIDRQGRVRLSMKEAEPAKTA